MKQILKRIIRDFQSHPLPTFISRDLEVPLETGKIITIIGPRRAGKTYYLFQLMAHLERQGVERENILYLNFEDERLDLAGDYDPILDAWQELYPEKDPAGLFIFFDEIQELPHWEKFIRRLYDSVSRNIFLTGSNAKMLSQEIATALRGRSLSFEILPLSFSEFLRFHKVDAADRHSSRNAARIHHRFEQYLTWGGYPELVSIDARFKPNVLQEYFNVVLFRDLSERYAIRDSSVLKYLVKRLLSSFTKEFSVNKLHNDLRSRGFTISKDLLYRMIDQIFSVYMVASTEKYDPAVVRRAMSNKKIYLFDNGFASIVHYDFFEDRGKLLENLVFRHLRGQTSKIYFLKNGWECDFFAFPGAKNPQLIQVTKKLHADNIARELKGLIKGKQRFTHATGMLLTGEPAPRHLSVPDWIAVYDIPNWLLTH